MSACYRPALTAAILLAAGHASGAVRPPARGVISLNSHRIDVARPPVAPEALRADAGTRGAEYVLVKFPGPVSAEQKTALAAATRRIYTYLPENAFLVRMDETPDRAARLARLGAAWSGPYHPLYKISRYVAAVSADAKPQPLMVMLHVYPDADLARVVEELGQKGVTGVVGSRRNPFFSRIRLLLPPAEVVRTREAIAQVPEVFWLETESRKVLLNDTTIWVGQSGLSAGMTTPVFQRGIFGEGQVVGIIDTGIDADMCYFRDTVNGPPPRNECNGGTVTNPAQRKVLAVDFLWGNECAGGIANNEWDTQDHGSHVAGTVAGDNFATILGHDAGDGMAPGAKLVIQDGGYLIDDCGDLPGIGCPVVDLNPLFQQAYAQGARLHTNSWGDQENASPQNDYTAASQDVDEFMWNHKDFQIFFAAGNSGPGTASVGSPSTAKSAVSVGSTLRGTSANTMSGFSSCGPTDDGRFKPEVTVPGSSIVSANADNDVASDNCNTVSMSGTSMASPGAAGLTALIRQYYADGFYPTGAASGADAFTPSAALLRATLVSSARQMTVPPAVPGDCQGWGRVLLDDALFFPGDTRRLWVKDDAAPFPVGTTGRNKVYNFTVAAGEPFKVTVAWTDFPSTPAAMPHLNNDLDLIVTGPGGVVYRGNVFAAGQSTTGGSADRRNTLEQVLLAAPAPGTYEVRVDGFNVPNGPQPLAIVVTGNVTQVAPPLAAAR
jgi:subtilisin family serine protease